MCLSGFSKKAVSTLKLVVDRYPSELSVWNDLGVKCLLAGQQEEARKAFTEVRIHIPNVFRSGTDLISLLICSCCSSCWGNLFKNSLRLHCFKSDLGEIWHDFSSSKYASIDGDRYPI